MSRVWVLVLGGSCLLVGLMAGLTTLAWRARRRPFSGMTDEERERVRRRLREVGGDEGDESP